MTQDSYDRVTRTPGSYKAFRRGLDLLLNNGIHVRLKAVATRSNFHELPQIAEFCRQHTMDYFRFDPLLNLRYDHDPVLNEEISKERLAPEEIVAIEQADAERARTLAEHCDHFIFPEHSGEVCNHLFHCGAGNGSFIVSYDGIFRLCGDLWNPNTTLDLKDHSLKEAWEELTLQVREMRSNSEGFLKRCRICPIVIYVFGARLEHILKQVPWMDFPTIFARWLMRAQMQFRRASSIVTRETVRD
ncbi:MAG: hypothetical protein LLG42_00485 [Chloroflexi bacterium]|nr:hypothetical protein [Chloroflexota bacterium]